MSFEMENKDIIIETVYQELSEWASSSLVKSLREY